MLRNLELCHCWFSVREGNMILCYCLIYCTPVWNLVLKLCLMSCRLELSQYWSMPALLLHERIAQRSHYHMGNPEFFFFFFNGPESCMLLLRNMSSSPHPPPAPKKKKTANDDWPFENCNVTTVRVKVKCRNPPFCKMNRDTMGWKHAGERKANMEARGQE